MFTAFIGTSISLASFKDEFKIDLTHKTAAEFSAISASRSPAVDRRRAPLLTTSAPKISYLCTKPVLSLALYLDSLPATSLGGSGAC